MTQTNLVTNVNKFDFPGKAVKFIEPEKLGNLV